MSIRRFTALVAAAASISLGMGTINAPSAVADVEEVGGGAAGIETRIFVQDADLRDILGDDIEGYESIISMPSVTLPRQGEARQVKFLAGQESGGVSVGAMKVTTEGNLQGTPYAESSATLVDIVGAGLDVHLLRAFCRWDTTGARATTSLVGANGSLYTPAPNTVIDLPGIGYAVLNEQFTETLDRGEEVIYVNGIHLVIEELSLPDALLLPPDGFDDTDIGIDIVLGMASCDPLKLPNLTSLLAPLQNLG